MSSSYNFKDNLTIDNNKYLKWLDITGTSRANIISLDNVNNVKINSGFGDLVLNSGSNSSYTYLNISGNSNGVIIGSKIGIGFNTTTNMNSILTLNKNNFIGINTTNGSNDGYLGLAGSSSLNSSGSRIILYGNESSSSNNGKLNLYAGNTSNGTINLFTGDDKIRFQILNDGTLNVLPDGVTSRLIINNTNSTFTNNVILSSGTASTNATTGALTVSGGMGITGNVFIQGSLNLTTTSVGNLNFSSSNVSTSYSSGAIVLTGGMGISNTTNSSSVTAGGALSIAGGVAIGKDLYVGGKFTVLNSTSATSSENASVVLYGGLGINNNILLRSDNSSQIKLSPTTEKSETSIVFYSKNNFTSTSNTGSSWKLGHNVNSISSGNFALANSQFGNVLSAEYSGKVSILGNVYIDSQILKIPKGTTAERPISAEQGFIRYNSELGQFEGFGSENAWGSLGGGGGGGNATTAGNIIANSINLGVSNMFSGSFTPSNNVGVASNITGLYFNNSDIRSFIINLTVSISRTIGGNLYEYFTLEGNQIESGWELLVSSIGDISGFDFTITSVGQIQYTSTNITDFSNSIIRYHVNEITNTGTYDRSGLETQGTLITNTMQILNTQDVNIGVNNGALYVAGGVTIGKSLYMSSGTANISNITSTNISVATVVASTSLSATGNFNTIGNIFTNSDNVGIGTTSPQTNLHVLGGGLQLGESNTTGFHFLAINGGLNGYSGTWGTGSTRFCVGSNGNFGIGTLTPRNNLEITQTSSTTGMLLYSGVNDAGVNRIEMIHTDDATRWRKVAIETQHIGGQPQGARAHFSIQVNTENNSINSSISDTRLFIHGTSGNIGIGTTSPSQTLDITGTGRITTSLTTGALFSTNLTSSNIVGTNISGGTLNLSSGLTSASAQITNENVTTSTIATLRNTNSVSTNISAGAINLSTGLTSASAQITNENVTTSTIATLRNTNAVSTNISTSTISATTFTGGSLSLSGNLNVAGSLTVVNITSTNLVNTNVSAGIVVASTSLSATGNSNTVGTIITTGGNVGIGTSSPSQKLEVSGALKISSNTNPTNDNVGIYIYDQANVGPTIAGAQFEVRTNGNNPRLRINGSGNVGIGTTSPGAILHINGSSGSLPTTPSGNGIFMGTDLSNNSGIQINSGSLGSSNFEYIDFGYNGVEYVTRIINSNVTRNLEFYVNGGTLAMTLQSIGNVSIPTLFSTNFTSTNVVSSNLSAGTLRISNITVGNTGNIRLNNDGSGLIWGNNFSRIYDDSQLRIYTDDQIFFHMGNTIGTAMYIGSNSNVGIGTTTPQTTFHIGTGQFQLGASNTAGFHFLAENGALSAYSGTWGAGLTRFCCDSRGNFGINTLTPRSLLHVVGPSGSGGTNGSTLITGRDTFGHTLIIDSYTNSRRLVLNHDNSVGNIFAYNYAGSASQNLNLQGPGGNVGIGTGTPGSKLHVVGNIRTDSIEMNAGGGSKQIANGIQGGGAGTGTVNFPFTFTNIPVVVASINQNINDTVFNVQISSITTTGFTYRKTFWRFSGTPFGGEATGEGFYWIAMG